MLCIYSFTELTKFNVSEYLQGTTSINFIPD